jgi:hypothetical protein
MSGTLNMSFRGLVIGINDFAIRCIRRIIESNYHLAKANYMRGLERAQRKFKEAPLLVYQMGKVGSSTIVRSLNAIGIDRPVYHPHFLTRERISKTEAERRQFFGTERYAYLKRPWLYAFLVKQLNKEMRGGKWKVVSLTREPVSRNLSVFFENLEIKPLDAGRRYEISSHYYRIAPTIIELSRLDVLSALFFEKVNHDSPDQFFEKEIKGILGVDVFKGAFPKSQGYCIYEGAVADILVLRLEDLNRVAGQAFFEFMGIADFELLNTNVGSEKHYAALYNAFKAYVHLPEAYLNRMYGSRYVRHFYSDAEIAGFRQKWRKAGSIETSEENLL